MSESPPPPSDRTRLCRKAERGHYDRATIDAILDEALICHVGFAVDGRPWVMPTAFARLGEHLYLHGASGNASLRALAGGAEACVTVTLLDGLVLARSAFHHSMNYRSVMVFGTTSAVTDESEKCSALAAIVDHMEAGRSESSRAPTDAEVRSTLVVRLSLEEASAKIRTGGPVDDDADYALEHWAGVIPLTLTRGEPVVDPGGRPG